MFDCDKCGKPTAVKGTWSFPDGKNTLVLRRQECKACGHAFPTAEHRDDGTIETIIDNTIQTHKRTEPAAVRRIFGQPHNDTAVHPRLTPEEQALDAELVELMNAHNKGE